MTDSISLRELRESSSTLVKQMAKQPAAQPQNSARELLVEWANGQENWVRRIAREVLSTRQPPSDEAIDEAYALCLSEKDLIDEPVVAEPILELGAAEDEKGESLRLVALKGVENVNRLAQGQEIQFNQRLTILYGENATGKSGYVRILKRVAAVRSAEPVLADIHATSTPGPPTARLEYALGSDAASAKWMGQAGIRPFTRMCIFDSRAVSFHLDDELTYSYTPRDLALFQYVNQGISAVASRLDAARTDAELVENPFLSRFQAGSVVYPKIETLSSATEVTALEALASISEGEADALPSLRVEVEALNPQLVASRLELLRTARELISRIGSAAKVICALDPEVYNDTLEKLSVAENTLRASSETAFSGFDVPGILSEAWGDFVASGDAYRHDLALEHYPTEGDACLYCRQELTKGAAALLRAYRDHVNNTFQADIDAAQSRLSGMTDAVGEVDLDALRTRIAVKLTATEGGTLATLFAEASEWLKHAPPVLEAISKRRPIASPGIFSTACSLAATASAVLAQVDGDIELLEKQKAQRQEARSKAEKKVRDLEDRIVLKAHLAAIRTAVENAKWAERASRIVSKRFPPLKASLTNQTKVASEDLLNTDFQRLFEQERKALRAPPVRLQFPGKDAAAARRKSLGDHRLSEVLSEGEQKVIALSDFLAEAAIRPSSSPILFDDPVNSLDYKRIEYIVDRICTLSSQHQVIVFTHNIWFASLLLAKFDDSKSVSACSFFSVDLGPGEQPGYIAGGTHPRLDSPSKIRGQINDLVQSARTATGETRKALIERSYSRLRAWCEAVSEQELLHGLSQRYRANIMVGMLRKIRADRLPAAAEVICRVFDRACGVIDAHAMATETLGSTPDLSDLEQDWKEAQEALAEYKA